MKYAKQVGENVSPIRYTYLVRDLIIILLSDMIL